MFRYRWWDTLFFLLFWLIGGMQVGDWFGRFGRYTDDSHFWRHLLSQTVCLLPLIVVIRFVFLAIKLHEYQTHLIERYKLDQKKMSGDTLTPEEKQALERNERWWDGARSELV